MLSFEVERERPGFNIQDMDRKRTPLAFSPTVLEDTKQWMPL